MGMTLSKISKECWWNTKYAVFGSLLGMMIGLFITPNDNLFTNLLTATLTYMALRLKDTIFSEESVYCNICFSFSKCNRDYLMYVGYMTALHWVTGVNVIMHLLQ